MLATSKVDWNPDLIIGWHALPSQERERLQANLEHLAATPPEQWPKDLAEPLDAHEPLYVTYALDGKLFVVFRRERDGTINVRDLVLRETIVRHFLPKKNGSPS